MFQGSTGQAISLSYNNPDGKRAVVTVRRKISEPIDRLKLFQNAHEVPVMFQACHPADSRSLVVVSAYGDVLNSGARNSGARGVYFPHYSSQLVKSGCINSCRRS